MHPDTGQLTVFVYDGHPGGAGFAERGFAAAREWLTATRETIAVLRLRRAAAPRACSPPSAATRTTRSTSTEPVSCWTCCCPPTDLDAGSRHGSVGRMVILGLLLVILGGAVILAAVFVSDGSAQLLGMDLTALAIFLVGVGGRRLHPVGLRAS